MKSGHKLVLAIVFAAVASSASIAYDGSTGRKSCYSAGCGGACPSGFWSEDEYTYACGIPGLALGVRVYCCEELRFISQAQKRKSPNAARVIKAPPRPVSIHTPSYTSAKVIKGDRPTSTHTPRYQFSYKLPASAKVTTAPPRSVSRNTSGNEFSRPYGSPLR